MDSLSDDSLSHELRAWNVTPPPDPQFRAATWARLESARRETAPAWGAYLWRHAGVWAVAGAVLVVGAGWTGLELGRRHTAAERETVLAGYVAAIDARAMVAAEPFVSGHP